MTKQNIKLIVQLTILTIVISYALDKAVFFAFNKISDKVMTGQSIGKLNQFLSVKDSVDLIVLGNSRANHHIDVEVLNPNSYNIGINGTGIAYIDGLINTFSESKKQLVLVHIDTKDFFDSSYEGADINALATKYNRDNNLTQILKKSGQISPLQDIYYSLNYNNKTIGIIKNYLKPNYNYKTYNGFDPLILNKSQKTIRNQILSQPNTKLCVKNLNTNSIALDYLKDIKKQTENKNKTYLFITSPIFNDSCKEDNIKLKEILQNLELTYWDLSDLFNKSNSFDLWKDETHLSQLGAEKFTAYLLNELHNKNYLLK